MRDSLRNMVAVGIMLSCSLLSSCFDLYSNKQTIDGPYYVASNPAGSGKTLWYAIDESGGIDRVDDVIKVGYSQYFIIAENKAGYYFIDKRRDSKYASANDVIGEPKTHEKYLRLLDSLKIKNFQFVYDTER